MVLIRAEAILTVEQLPTIMGGLVLAAVLWVVKGTRDNSQTLAVLQSTMEKIVIPELDRLRNSGHAIREIAQQAVSATELLEQRMDQGERDITALFDGQDRRHRERRSGT